MQKTLKIEVPAGYEIDSLDKATNSVILKQTPTDVRGRIRTLDDVFKDNGTTSEQFEESIKAAGLSKDESAYRFLKLLAKSLNEGWTPDWNDDNQYKYYPWFYMGGSSGFRFHGVDDWRSGSSVGSRLCFKSRELAEYAATNFIAAYKQYMIIEE